MNHTDFFGKTAMGIVSHFELHPVEVNAGIMGVLVGEAELALYAIHYASLDDEEWVFEHPVKVKIVGINSVQRILTLRTVDNVCPIPGVRMIGTFGLKYEPTVYVDDSLACDLTNIDWHYDTRDKFGEDGLWQRRDESALAA